MKKSGMQENGVTSVAPWLGELHNAAGWAIYIHAPAGQGAPGGGH